VCREFSPPLAWFIPDFVTVLELQKREKLVFLFKLLNRKLLDADEDWDINTD